MPAVSAPPLVDAASLNGTRLRRKAGRAWPCSSPATMRALTVGGVVKAFRDALPDAVVYVYDNNSTDGTAELARQAGAVVRRENRQGKGYVIQAMFRDIDADYYVMADGDGTYPADQVQVLLAPLLRGDADMVVGNRLQDYTGSSFRPLHVFGNKLVVGTINLLFARSSRTLCPAIAPSRGDSCSKCRWFPAVSRLKRK